jgi:hypothetical protein
MPKRQSDGGEDHRGRDGRTRDPAGDRREGEQGQGDNGDCPVHALTPYSGRQPLFDDTCPR